MNDFDKNFHINFSPLYFAFAFMVFMLWASEAKASDIEEVVVVGQQEQRIETDPIESNTLMSAIMPVFTYNAGGYGGAVFFNERGAQTVHTAVFRNGIPANDPGGAWYNFGHDIVSGETVKVISGANSVMYGSGAMAGTVLIEDTITRGVTLRNLFDAGVEPQFIRVAPINQIEISSFKDTIDSARNDNDEEDSYEQKSLKFKIDASDFEIVGKYTDYEYDYDNCYNFDWESSNDCLEVGERYNIAIRNSYFTIGRNYNNAEYFTNDVSNEGTYVHQDMTYTNESYRDFVRVGNDVKLSQKLNVAFGVDGERNIYNIESFNGQGSNAQKYQDENFGAYLNVNAEFALKYNFGLRVGNDEQNAVRLGISQGQFFLNLGNSFRKPNLYEQFGDNWVDANPDLLPEEGVGYEIGFGAISLFRYDFEETIEYQPSYTTTVVITPATYDEDGNILTEEVTEDIVTNAIYSNGGEYYTQGFRFNNNFGPVGVMLKYTDTEQPRIPKFAGAITFKQMFNDYLFIGRYAVNIDRSPGQYDVLPEGQEYLEDLNRLDLSVIKNWDKLQVAFKLNNALDDVVEVLPGYDNRGREVFVTVQYNY